MEPKKLALIRILQILHEHSDYDHPLTHEDIIKRLDIDYGIEDFSDVDCKSVRVAFSEKRQNYKELIDEAAIAASKEE